MTVLLSEFEIRARWQRLNWADGCAVVGLARAPVDMPKCLRLHRVQLTLILHQKVRGHGQSARGGADHVAEIAKAVVIGVGGDGRIESYVIWGQQVGTRDGWMLT
jgi:hypothetical protein